MMPSAPSDSPRSSPPDRVGPAVPVGAARALVVAIASAWALAAAPAAAQEVPGEGLTVAGGVVETGLHLRAMTGVRRVLVIGAHPDDEDTALLAALDRGRGVRAAYLSLTRGEGGQNLIGPELGKGLGLIRTGELLAARRLDGAEQFFSRAYDFGYSKTAKETFRHWPRRELLSDVVWVLRVFRPHVVVSVFSGTEADGHGQHQVAGMLAREAFGAAGDPDRFPEHMAWGARPWRPLKLYRRAWRDPERATLRVATGEYDPLLGRSSFQLAMESRSQHRSQDFGVARPPGPRHTRLLLLEDRTGTGADAPLFAGMDTTLASLADDLPWARREPYRRAVRRYVRRVEEARGSLRALDPRRSVPALEGALQAIREARQVVGAGATTGSAGPGPGPADAARSGEPGAEAAGPAADPGRREDVGAVLDRKVRLAGKALVSARGIVGRFRAASDRWVAGETVRVHAELWNGGSEALDAGPPALDLPGGWEARLLPRDSVPGGASAMRGFYGADRPILGGDGPAALPAGALARWTFEVRVPADAEPTEPYFLARDTAGDLYRWPEDGDLRARPMDPPVATGSVPLRAAGGPGEEAVELSSPVRYRGVDKARGEFWRPVRVVPRASVDVSPRVVVWPAGGDEGAGRGGAPPGVTVTVRSLAARGLDARVSLETGEGLAARPSGERIRLHGAGERASVTFELFDRSGEADGAARVTRAATGEAEDEAEAWDEDAFRTHRLRARAVPAGEGDGSAAGARASGWDRAFTLLDHAHIDPVPFYEDAAVRVERFPVRADGDRRVGYVMGSGDQVPDAIRQLGLEVETLGAERLRAGDFSGLDLVVLGVRAYEVREDLRAANDALLEWVRAGGTLVVQYNKYEFDEGGYAPFEVSIDRPHDRVTDERSPVTLLRPDAPVLSSPNRIGQRDFRGWIQERGLYFLHSWPESMTPVLAMSDPGEEPERGSLLVAPLGDGLYVHTGLAFFRQLPAGVPGAYRLFANLLSLEPAEWRAWLEGDRGGGGSR